MLRHPALPWLLCGALLLLLLLVALESRRAARIPRDHPCRITGSC